VVNKVKACVFISGNGTNLNSIIKSSRDNSFPINIGLIISNNANAKGLGIAKKYGIPFKYFSNKNKIKFERNSLYEMKKKKIKLLCLAGFMKILSKNFIRSFNNKIINIHPSLLPKFKGLNTCQRVLKHKEKFSGCSVHFVTPTLDSGKIIKRKRVEINKNETEASLKNKILSEEHKIFSQSIISIFQ
jgi:phosphoribosylglycinamide formyltransferase 1